MWTYKNKEFKDIPQDYIGFVYLITNKTSGRKYIGKKIFWNSVKKAPLKGKKRRRISKKESNWQVYYGSNDLLKEEVEENKDNYTREILHLCKNKSEMSYLETKEIIIRDALLTEDYYNGWLSVKVHHIGLKDLAN